MAFTFTPTELQGVLVVTPDTYPDDRGSFRETYRASAFGEAGLGPFVQSNVSRSRRGVLRGLHYQREPVGVGKLVSVARGRIFDVAVDVRPKSPTFGRWVGEDLSAEDGRMLYAPRGFAHGFCALEDETIVAYLMTGEFSPEHDTGVRWDDPRIGVTWPIEDPVLSEKDRALPALDDIEAAVGIDRAAEEARR